MPVAQLAVICIGFLPIIFHSLDALATVLRLSLTFALGCPRTIRLWMLRCPLYNDNVEIGMRLYLFGARYSVSLHQDTRLIMKVSIWFAIGIE